VSIKDFFPVESEIASFGIVNLYLEEFDYKEKELKKL